MLVLVLGMPVVVLVFFALLLASALEPLIDRVRSRSPLGRGATLLLVYLGFFWPWPRLLLLVVPGRDQPVQRPRCSRRAAARQRPRVGRDVEPKPISVASSA